MPSLSLHATFYVISSDLSFTSAFSLHLCLLWCLSFGFKFKLFYSSFVNILFFKSAWLMLTVSFSLDILSVFIFISLIFKMLCVWLLPNLLSWIGTVHDGVFLCVFCDFLFLISHCEPEVPRKFIWEILWGPNLKGVPLKTYCHFC